MKSINIKQLKQIQLDILSEVDDFCQKHNIKYSISYGTAIGAIRHKGFIPWDDDIDLVMLREEYEEFIATYKDSKGVYKLHCLENDPSYELPFAKVENSHTLLCENSTAKTLGINIDIFPVDYLANTKLASEKIVDEISKERFKLKVKLILPGNKNIIIKKIGIYFFKLLYRGCRKHTLAMKIQNLALQNNNRDKKKYCGVVVWGYGKKEILPSSVYDDYISVVFENKKIKIMKDYDIYLSTVYGDYMKLPPVEKRQSPHTLNNIFWKDRLPKDSEL